MYTLYNIGYVHGAVYCKAYSVQYTMCAVCTLQYTMCAHKVYGVLTEQYTMCSIRCVHCTVKMSTRIVYGKVIMHGKLIAVAYTLRTY